MIRVKRIYETADRADGFRVLVDRLWPRGIRKQDAAIDLWLRDIAPSAELRRWFGHDPAKWSVFCRRYAHELAAKDSDVKSLRDKARTGTVTLVYSAADVEHNNAVALKRYLAASPAHTH